LFSEVEKLSDGLERNFLKGIIAISLASLELSFRLLLILFVSILSLGEQRIVQSHFVSDNSAVSIRKSTVRGKRQF
jgi:hypothetical protein